MGAGGGGGRKGPKLMRWISLWTDFMIVHHPPSGLFVFPVGPRRVSRFPRVRIWLSLHRTDLITF